MSLQKCTPVKFEELPGVGECSSYQKLVYNWVVHVFFESNQFIRKLILEPPKIKKLLKVQKKSLLSVDKLLYYRSSNFSDFICDF